MGYIVENPNFTQLQEIMKKNIDIHNKKIKIYIKIVVC